MLWQTEVGVVSDSPEIQPQSQTPSRGNVPMEEQEARANRFVSQVVGHMENEKQQLPSNKLRLWQLADQRVQRLESLLERAILHREACLDRLNDQTS